MALFGWFNWWWFMLILGAGYRKMFIGGLNWETTDQSLKDYFSQYGEVQECTVMRDGATGRSRGFGFLTFRDPKTVNVVMVKEHYLDGKIVRPSISILFSALCDLFNEKKTSLQFAKIDPKRAIPRDEQERTSKIFVGGVSQEATEADFKEYFMQYGRVVDATLMMDKDTGRPRGFGFVTFDSEAAVDATFQGDMMILGKPIEVKKAQPRGNMRDEDDSYGRRGGRRGGKEFRDDRANYDNNSNSNQNQNQPQQNGQGSFAAGMTPQMMAQYWTRIQQYMAVMQQQAATQMSGGMNPAMMQQMAQMQQMQQMKQQMQQMAARQQGSQSPMPQSPGVQGMPGMNPAMMQQMQQMQAMQQQMQGGGGFGGPMVPNMPSPTPGGGFGGRRGTPGYNAQDQLAFEQQKYEQQQARRAAQEQQHMQYQHGGPTSWEGMYDDVPQPNMGGHGGGMGRGGRGGRGGGGHNHGHQQQQQQQQQQSQGPQSAPPANAPTGPKNAGKPGANYRGGGHRGAHRGFHPYSRN
ncbi:MAG: hypothetical protein Q9218_003792 [Villophora microphyllina]